MNPHQSVLLRHRVPDKVQDWFAVRTNCYAVHLNVTYSNHTGVNSPSSAQTMKHVSGYGTAKYYATVSSSYSSRSLGLPEQLHGSPPTCRLGLPPDKDAGCSSLLNLPDGRDDPPDKEMTFICMNGSTGDPPGSVLHLSKRQKNPPSSNPTGDNTTLPYAGGFQSIFNHFLSTQNLSGKGTGSGTDARTCKQITVPK